MVNLETKLGDLSLKNPIITASGTYGYSNEFGVFCDVQKIGAIVTKGITLESREGNEGQRIFETNGGMINRIGLENIGIQAFLKEKLPILEKNKIDFILNIAGSTFDDYVKLAKVAQSNNIRALELNVSCPNVKSGCIEFGTNKDTLYKLVSKVRDNYKNCLIVKLSPNVANPEEIAMAAENADADVISAINTVRGAGVKLDFANGQFKKTVVSGGFSGSAIKPIALSFIDKISKVVDIPIIGMGGIYCLEDILEFFSVGAKAVQLGTANFTHPQIATKLADDLEKFMIEHNFSTIDELQDRLKEA